MTKTIILTRVVGRELNCILLFRTTKFKYNLYFLIWFTEDTG